MHLCIANCNGVVDWMIYFRPTTSGKKKTNKTTHVIFVKMYAYTDEDAVENYHRSVRGANSIVLYAQGFKYRLFSKCRPPLPDYCIIYLLLETKN